MQAFARNQINDHLLMDSKLADPFPMINGQ